jgi:hypothetical protein
MNTECWTPSRSCLPHFCGLLRVAKLWQLCIITAAAYRLEQTFQTVLESKDIFAPVWKQRMSCRREALSRIASYRSHSVSLWLEVSLENQKASELQCLVGSEASAPVERFTFIKATAVSRQASSKSLLVSRPSATACCTLCPVIQL